MKYLFNAKKMRSKASVTSRVIRRDIRRIKERSNLWAEYPDNSIEISWNDREWRTRYYWEDYFIKRGFSVTHRSSESRGDSVKIGW